MAVCPSPVCIRAMKLSGPSFPAIRRTVSRCWSPCCLLWNRFAASSSGQVPRNCSCAPWLGAVETALSPARHRASMPGWVQTSSGLALKWCPWQAWMRQAWARPRWRLSPEPMRCCTDQERARGPMLPVPVQ